MKKSVLLLLITVLAHLALAADIIGLMSEAYLIDDEGYVYYNEGYPYSINFVRCANVGMHIERAFPFYRGTPDQWFYFTDLTGNFYMASGTSSVFGGPIYDFTVTPISVGSRIGEETEEIISHNVDVSLSNNNLLLCGSFSDSSYEIAISNILGKRIYSTTAYPENEKSIALDVDMEEWPSGNYFISINGANKPLKTKFILLK